MSSDNTQLTLADICTDVSYGYTESATFEKIGPKFLRITDIQGGVFDWTKVPFCQASPQDAKKYRLEVGDIVVARTGNSTGENAQVFSPPPPAVFASYLIRFRPDNNLVNPFFVGYQLRTERFRQHVLSVRGGSAQPGANAKQLGLFPVQMIDRSQQNAVVNTLRAIDDRITLLREINQTLEAIAQALFKSWFVDFDPVRAKAEGRLFEGIDEATAALFPDAFGESELGMVPKGWKVDTFENCLAVLETGRRPKGGVAGIESGIPSIGAESVTKIGDFDYSKLKYVSAEFFETMKSGKLESRDVLLYKDGGKPGVFLPRVSMFGEGFPFEICGINEHVFRIRVKAPLSQTFIYFWLWSDSVMHELKHRGGKAAIPGINQKDVKELKIAIPSDGVLTQFDSVTSPFISQVLSNSKLIKLLSDLRDTLLPRLISGQLRIADAEAELEKAKA